MMNSIIYYLLLKSLVFILVPDTAYWIATCSGTLYHTISTLIFSPVHSFVTSSVTQSHTTSSQALIPSACCKLSCILLSQLPILSDKLKVTLYTNVTVHSTQSQTAGYPVSYKHRFWYSVTNCILLSQVLILSHKLQVVLYPMITGSGTQSQTGGYPVSSYQKFWYSVTNWRLSFLCARCLVFLGVRAGELGRLEILDTLVEQGEWIL